jgi:nucleoside-diphosphate-sugar epimerase
MRALVTGAAGFIGSNLSESLVGCGDHVTGVDCLSAYYSPAAKLDNVEGVQRTGRFTLVTDDLRVCDLRELLDGVDVVYHLAAQPGVRLSWADGFGEYVTNNVIVTQRLLEAAKTAGITRFVYASSSSVYGNAPAYPTGEKTLPRPHSPYGVTKLGGEQLCALYADNWGVPTVSLRYFTVYGPRQRPDMAIHRLIVAALGGHPFTLYGSGEQVRDFTYVDDVVTATLLAGAADVAPGAVINVAGGSSTTMNRLIRLVEAACGVDIELTRLAEQPGDVARTGGATQRASRWLGWEPSTDLATGVMAQAAWHRSRARGGQPIPVGVIGGSGKRP